MSKKSKQLFCHNLVHIVIFSSSENKFKFASLANCSEQYLHIKIEILWDNIAMLLAREHAV